MKRKYEDDPSVLQRPIKRLSMLDNTPQQWKEQRRKILKLSKQKLKTIVDAECNLRKSVLVNNTYRRMKRELRDYNCYSPPSSWQYTPKSLFPHRASSVLMDVEDIGENPTREHSHMIPVDDIDSKDLSPPAADLSEVLSDILNEEDMSNTMEPDAILDIVQTDKENTPSGFESDNMDTSSACDTESSLSAEEYSSAPVDLTYKQEVDHDEPVNYSLHENTDCDTTTRSNTDSVSEEQSSISSNNSSDKGESQDSCVEKSNRPSNSIEDFVIGRSSAWTSDKCSFPFPSLGSMFPICDLSNYTFFLPSGPPSTQFLNSSEHKVLNPCNSSAQSDLGARRVLASSDTLKHQCVHSHCDCNALVSNLTACDRCSSENKENTDSEESSCDSLLSEGSSDSSLDGDINQHIWACFQQFNMAVACS